MAIKDGLQQLAHCFARPYEPGAQDVWRPRMNKKKRDKILKNHTDMEILEMWDIEPYYRVHILSYRKWYTRFLNSRFHDGSDSIESIRKFLESEEV